MFNGILNLIDALLCSKNIISDLDFGNNKCGDEAFHKLFMVVYSFIVYPFFHHCFSYAIFLVTYVSIYFFRNENTTVNFKCCFRKKTILYCVCPMCVSKNCLLFSRNYVDLSSWLPLRQLLTFLKEIY